MNSFAHIEYSLKKKIRTIIYKKKTCNKKWPDKALQDTPSLQIKH